VSCSSNNAPAFLEAASLRLIAAIAASTGMHAAFVAWPGGPLGARWDSVSWFEQKAAPLRAVLREPASAESAAPRERTQAAVAAEPMRAPLPPAPRYYRTRELDVVPGIMTRVEPQYPESAARRFLTGKVVVRLFIDESGKVERVLTLRADRPGYFEQPAERAFRAARFSPGVKSGRAVKVQMTLEVRFEHPAPPQW
jgi:TonB family protein